MNKVKGLKVSSKRFSSTTYDSIQASIFFLGEWLSFSTSKTSCCWFANSNASSVRNGQSLQATALLTEPFRSPSSRMSWFLLNWNQIQEERWNVSISQKSTIQAFIPIYFTCSIIQLPMRAFQVIFKAWYQTVNKTTLSIQSEKQNWTQNIW